LDNFAFRFSTDGLPPDRRLAVWREAFCDNVLKADVMPPEEEEGFHADLSIGALPGMTVSQGSNSAPRLEQRRHFADSDDLFLIMPTAGQATGAPLGREVAFEAGTAVLAAGDQRGLVCNSPGFSYMMVRLPRQDFEAGVFDFDRRIMRPLDVDREALGLLHNYVALLVAGSLPARADLQQLCVSHARDLVGLVLGPRPDAAEAARGGGLRAARLDVARLYIRDNLGDLGLSIHTVAARQKISARYLQLLFEAEGITFSEFVLRQRLDRAHRMLTDPRLAARPIGAIALDAGFGDLSYFNLTFRRRYGGTPSDIRAATRQA
jgi:AraC-like DNA-binding protein